MGCAASSSSTPSPAGGDARSSLSSQKLDPIPEGAIHAIEAAAQTAKSAESGKYALPARQSRGPVAHTALLSMAMEAEREVGAGGDHVEPTRRLSSSHPQQDDGDHLNNMPDLAYSIREPSVHQQRVPGETPSSGASGATTTQPGVSKNVVVNRPTMQNLQLGGVNDDFSDPHAGHFFPPMQPFHMAGLRGTIPPLVPTQQAQGAIPNGTRMYSMAAANRHPHGALHLAPLAQAAYTSSVLSAASRAQQLHELGSSAGNLAVGRGRGRGLPSIVVTPAAMLGLGEFGGPAMAFPGRGGPAPLAMGRGRGYPLQIVIPGSQNSHRGQQSESMGRSQRTDRHPSTTRVSEAVELNATTAEKDIDDDDEDEDNDDLVEDDEEVEDWGLEGETEVDPAASPHSPVDQPHPTGPNRAPPLVSSPAKCTASPSTFPTKKLRPTLELGDPDVQTVDSDSAADDDSDDAGGGADDELHDWLDTDPEPPHILPRSSAQALSRPQTTRQPDHPSTARTPQSSPIKTSRVPPSPAPTSRPGYPPPSTSSPHPPLPSQQASIRHLHNPVGGANTSPTRPAGYPPTGGSPVKPTSYRSNIVTNGVPLMVPHLNAASSPTTARPGDPTKAPSGTSIRDTTVVKKKRAELPKANMPHPAPKFGDWLNSRTMINNYIILEALGAGSYAEVKLCKEKVTGKLFAMKFINRDVMKKDKLGKQSKLDDIKREIAIMKKLNHPNVLRLYEVMDDPSMNKLFLVLEYMKHGDLLSHKKKKHPTGASENLHDRDLHCVTLQVILGLAYLHEQKIVHGDIKPQNLLVGDKDVVKIADFGISQSLYGSKQKLSDTAGTPAFMSPEMCSGQEYSGQLADIWAVGATVFMLKYGQPPFVAKSAMQMFERIQNDPLIFPGPIDPMLEDLLRGMMTKNPTKRMTLLQIMTHPWVTKEEHPSHFGFKEKLPQITVTSEEVDNAIDASDKFAIIVNIRVQMMKRLQRSRDQILKRRQAAAVNNGSPHKLILPDVMNGSAASDTRAAADLVVVDTIQTSSQAEKIVAKRSSRPPLSKVFIDTISEIGGKPRAVEPNVLSNEEIQYRSQLFTRKKVSGVAGANSSSSAAFPKPSAGHDDHLALHGTDGGELQVGDDEEIFSDDDDDEHAVSQSPQLLDELLLTTLSMPPLTKSSPLHDLGNDATTVNGSAAAVESSLSTGSHAHHAAPDTQSFHAHNRHLNLTVAVASLQGRRNTQEDRWTVLPEISQDTSSRWSKSLFCGVYDGHGGDECATILQDQLHTWLFRAPDEHFASVERVQNLFLEFDSFMCDFLLHKGDLSGSTATCVLVDHTTSSVASGCFDLLVGHVGDCRLVLSRRDGAVEELTRDHRLTLESERARVLELGGRVVNNRVNGVMAITRAFGDLEFKGLLGGGGDGHSGSSMALLPRAVQQNPFHKASDDEERTPALLSARPDVHAVRVDAMRDEFLLLACDGLWDVLTSEEAAAVLRERLRLHGDAQLAAKELAQEGIRRYSNDNITVLVVVFPPPS